MHFKFYDDDNTTHEIPGRPAIATKKTDNSIYYSLSTQTLINANGEIISLPKITTRLIRFMAQKNLARGGEPTPCRFLEMIDAVWGDESYGKEPKHINHLVWQIRKKIETDPSNPQYIKNLPADGYILHIPLRP